MTLVTTGISIHFPDPFNFPRATVSATIDAATEKVAMLGRLAIDGRPVGTKTLSTGTIKYRTGAVTFASGTTKVDIGLQSVASGSGPIAQPNGTYTVKTTLTGGGGGITANGINTATMNSGIVSLSNGDLVAVVFDMTAVGGADSVIISTGQTWITNSMGSSGMPTTNAFVSSAWQTTQMVRSDGFMGLRLSMGSARTHGRTRPIRMNGA